jgi:hypothetical protein
VPADFKALKGPDSTARVGAKRRPGFEGHKTSCRSQNKIAGLKSRDNWCHCWHCFRASSALHVCLGEVIDHSITVANRTERCGSAKGINHHGRRAGRIDLTIAVLFSNPATFARALLRGSHSFDTRCRILSDRVLKYVQSEATPDHAGDPRSIAVTRQTASGGPSNLGGTVYQILWCLLRAVKIHVGELQIEHSQPTESPTPPILVLEPLGGGGDLQVIGQEFEVEQIKAKASEGAWSLQSIIAEVLPDLFLAESNPPGRPCIYRFVTEGRLGHWREVLGFFETLRHRPLPADVLSGLDDARPLRFQRQTVSNSSDSDREPFFPQPAYTERNLFLRIALELKKRAAIRALSLSDTELHRRLWKILASFDFVESKTTEAIKREIDWLLLRIVDRVEDVPDVRRSLAMSLIEKASHGSFQLVTSEFLAEHNLNATPLSNWASLRDRAGRELKATFREIKYDNGVDVRRDSSESVFQLWASSGKALVITGECGQGKTWQIAAIASAASEDLSPVVWIESKRDAESDLQAVAHRFWVDIRGGVDSPIPLRQIATRLQTVVPQCGPYRLRVFIDGISDYQEALGIIQEDWSSKGVQFALACSVPVAESLQKAYPDRVFVHACNDFSWEELHKLLRSQLGEEWVYVPDHVRELLRRPLLASIYCDQLFDTAWVPNDEYELYQAVWNRLATGAQTNFPLDVARLESLASAVLACLPYPWTPQQVSDHEIDNECLDRLERCGWILRTTDRRFRIFHDRLLNWAVAQSLWSAVGRGAMTIAQLLLQLADIWRRHGDFRFANLALVPLDVIWIGLGARDVPKSFGKDALIAMESVSSDNPNTFYREVVPVFGARIVDSLVARVREFEGPMWVVDSMVGALGAIAGNDITEVARTLLNDKNRKVQRRGLRLLKRIPCPALLDRL